MERAKKIISAVFSVDVYRYALLIVTLLNTVTLLFSYTSKANPVFLIWGVCILIRDFFTQRNLFKNRGRFFLLAFLLGYLITIFLMGRNTFYGNTVVFGYTAINLLLLYAYSPGEDRELVIRRLKRFLTILVVFTACTAIASLVIFFGHLTIAYPSSVDGSTEYMGFIGNRLWGINGNPNPCGIQAAYSIVGSVMLFCWVKKGRAVKRILLALNLALQLMVMAGVKSRGADIALMLFCGAVGLFGGYLLFVKASDRLIKTKTQACKVWKKLACGALSVFLMAGLLGGSYLLLGKNQLLLAGMDQKLQTILQEDREGSGGDGAEKAPSSQTANAQRPITGSTGRDITNGRSQIWEAGLQVFRDHPVWGVSFKNVAEESYKYAEHPWSLPGIEGGGMHNVYLQVAVSNGAVGLICFLGALIVFAAGAIRYLRRFSQRPSRWYMVFLLAFICMVLGYNMVESRMLYSIGYAPLLFWYLAGAAMYFVGKDTGRTDRENILSRLAARLTPKRFRPPALVQEETPAAKEHM